MLTTLSPACAGVNDALSWENTSPGGLQTGNPGQAASSVPQWDLRDKPIRSFDFAQDKALPFALDKAPPFAQDKALPFALDGPHTTLWTASTLRLWTAPTLRSGRAKEWGDLLVPVTKQRRLYVMSL